MKRKPTIPEDLFVSHGKEVEAIFRRAVRQELLKRKKLGYSIATWKDGKVVVLKPEEIPVSEDDKEPNTKEVE